MENTSSNVIYRSLQSYWRRKAYQRLDGSASTSKRIVRLGERKRSLKVRSLRKVFRIRVRIPSPKNLLLQLRDAYVNAMLVLAGGVPNTSKRSTKVESVWGKRIPKAREVKVGDFEMRMMLHIYNTVIMSAPRELTSCA